MEKINPIGGDPEVCSFRFSGLRHASGAMMDGDIRYVPGTNSSITLTGSMPMRGNRPEGC